MYHVDFEISQEILGTLCIVPVYLVIGAILVGIAYRLSYVDEIDHECNRFILILIWPVLLLFSFVFLPAGLVYRSITKGKEQK